MIDRASRKLVEKLLVPSDSQRLVCPERGAS